MRRGYITAKHSLQDPAKKLRGLNIEARKCLVDVSKYGTHRGISYIIHKDGYYNPKPEYVGSESLSGASLTKPMPIIKLNQRKTYKTIAEAEKATCRAIDYILDNMGRESLDKQIQLARTSVVTPTQTIIKLKIIYKLIN